MIIGFAEKEIIDANNRMRYYRKTKKKGGNVVYRCPKPGDKSYCIKSYLEDEHIQLIRIPPDGDCFFNSIATYFKNKGINITHQELRAKVIAYMEEHREAYLPFFVVESDKPSVVKATLTRQLNQLKKPGFWNNQLADFIPQQAPKALDINIRLHEVDYAGNTISVHILRDDNKPFIITDKYPIIDVLRINNNHYELLRPMKKGNNSLHKSDSKTKVSIKTNSNTKKNINNSISEDELKILGKQ